MYTLFCNESAKTLSSSAYLDECNYFIDNGCSVLSGRRLDGKLLRREEKPMR